MFYLKEVLALGGIAASFFYIRNPAGVIELQRKAYAWFNWNIAPISLSKELRNTRLMGWFLLTVSFISLFLKNSF
jgi:hypothetical protein